MLTGIKTSVFEVWLCRTLDSEATGILVADCCMLEVAFDDPSEMLGCVPESWDVPED